MAATSTTIRGLDLKEFKEAVTKKLITEQTLRLAEYAKLKIVAIGDSIKAYHSANHMDRTGNLLDSLCWGVSYKGRLARGGFYRSAKASEESYLHEWFSGDEKYLFPVNGHELAYNYLFSYGNNGSRGWRVFFAILAPYWGYWEQGFTMKSHYGGGSQRLQFAVMTEYYDQVKDELKPMRVRFRVSVPKYKHEELKERWKRKFF